MVRIQESKGQFFITLPKRLAEAKNWSKGMELKLEFNEKGELIIRESEKQKNY